MQKKSLMFLLVVSVFVASPALQAKGGRKADAKYQKPVKMLIGAIRYKKDSLAMKQLALGDMAKALCVKHWSKMSGAQRAEFTKGLGTLLRKLSFPKARDIFKHIDAILYDPAKVSGGKATLRSTIVVHRAYKKKELVITWTLIKKGKKWKIFDTVSVGESTVKGIQEDQVDPLVKEGGIALLMKKLREKIASTK